MLVSTQRGIESFMEAASEGWSWLAVRSPLERMARALQQSTNVVIYEPEVSYRPLRGNPVLRDELDRRHAFAVQWRGSPWSFLLRTIDWITTVDAVATRRMAAELSSHLVTETVASIGAYGGAECRYFRYGKEVGRVDSDDPTSGLYEFLDEREIWLPACFIGSHGDCPTLYLDSSGDVPVRRVDRVLLKANSRR